MRLVLLCALVLAAVSARSAHRSAPLFPPEHPNVKIDYTLINADISSIPVKEYFTILGGFVNDADSPMNVTGLIARLHNPLDFYDIKANLSSWRIGEVVEPTDEVAYEYRGIVGFDLPEYPYPLQLAVTLFYVDEQTGANYASTFFNETVSFAAPKNHWKIENVIFPALKIALVVLFFVLLAEAIPGLGERIRRLQGKKAPPSQLLNIETNVPSIAVPRTQKKRKRN